MDDFPIPNLPIDLESVLEMLKKQETFLNVNPNVDSPVYWILLSAKCLLAGYGTYHLLSTCLTVTFVIGTLINACINLTSWFVPAFIIFFGAATFKILGDGDRSVLFPTLCWVSFCMSMEGEFYMDIYLVLCFIGFIFKMYGSDNSKAVAFIFSMICFNWMVDNEEIYITENVIFMIVNFVLAFFILRPSNDDWEYQFGRRCYYYCTQLAFCLSLLFKYYTISLQKGYIQDPLDFFRMVFDAVLSTQNQHPVLSDMYEIFENFRKPKLALYQQESEEEYEEIIINLNSSMPSLSA